MRRRTFLRSSLAVMGTPVVARAPADAAGDPADLIVYAATIRTVEPARPVAEAFAVRGGRFVAVGSRADVAGLRGPRTDVVDLGSATVLPGFIDAHLHLTSVGAMLHEADLEGAPSFAEVVRRTVAFAGTSRDAWIRGAGWDQNLWPDKAFPVHDALSAAIPDRPVVLERIDGHALLANAKAMQLAGVGRVTSDPAGGRILRDAGGDPTGVFVDTAMQLIERAVPAPDHDQLVRRTRSGVAEANRFGITAIGEAYSDAASIAALEELARAGDLPLRVHVMLADDPALLATYFARGPLRDGHAGRISIRAVKMFADGALGSRGAALLEPYSDDPTNSGLLRTSPEHIADVTSRALASGFQTCVHAIGDRANRMVLDAYEAALRGAPPGDHRLRIEHAQVLSTGDVPRFAQLGIIPSMQTTHQISDMGWAQARLGPDRVKGAYAWRSLLDTGVIIANGTDAPVESVNPLRTFLAAVARTNERNEPSGGWYPEQRMTRDEALNSMTIWAAHANFAETQIGSIAAGKYADFVVLDRDLMLTAPETIMETRILATYSSGSRVYDATRDRLAGIPRGTRARRRAACPCTVALSG